MVRCSQDNKLSFRGWWLKIIIKLDSFFWHHIIQEVILFVGSQRICRILFLKWSLVVYPKCLQHSTQYAFTTIYLIPKLNPIFVLTQFSKIWERLSPPPIRSKLQGSHMHWLKSLHTHTRSPKSWYLDFNPHWKKTNAGQWLSDQSTFKRNSTFSCLLSQAYSQIFAHEEIRVPQMSRTRIPNKHT